MKKIDKKKWGKRLAFFAVFGVTGVVALLGYNVYRSMRGIEEIDWDNLEF